LAIFFWDFFQWIKSNRKIQVCRIENNDIFFSVFGDVFEDIIDEVTVGIKEGKSSSIDDIRITKKLEKF